MGAGSERLFVSIHGNALILAVLILLVLSSVGVVAMQRTNTDLMVSGNIARANQAFSASDMGTQHALALVGQNTQGYLHAVEQIRKQPNLPEKALVTYRIVDATTAATTMPPSIPTTGNLNIVRTENIWISTMDGGISKARMLQDIAYRAKATWTNQKEGAVATSKDADICYQIYDFETQGAIPTRIENVGGTLNPANIGTVVIKSRARAMAGPTKCRLTH